MSERSGAAAGAGGASRSVGQKVKRTIQSKVLVPLAAAAVSAGASYLAKKLPLILEDRILPKLRENGAPELAKKVESLTEALPGVSPSSGNGSAPPSEEPTGQSEEQQQEQGSDDGGSPQSSGPTDDEREAARREREERRNERRRALSSA